MVPVDPPTECKSGGLHPPNQETVNDFVRQVRGRIRYGCISTLIVTSFKFVDFRYFSVCGPASDIAAEVSEEAFFPSK